MKRPPGLRVAYPLVAALFVASVGLFARSVLRRSASHAAGVPPAGRIDIGPRDGPRTQPLSCSLTDATDLMDSECLATRARLRGHLLRTGAIDAPTAASVERGRVLFLHEFTATEGLGPHYNRPSCVACHTVPGPLGGGTFDNATQIWGPDPDHPRLTGEDDAAFPVRRFSLPGTPADVPPPGHVFLGARVPSSLRGLGWVGAVPTEYILSRAGCDPLHAPAGSPCGHVTVRDTRPSLRFSTRSGVSSLEEFVASAFESEMGLQTQFFMNHHAVSEVSSQQILDLANYIGLSPAVPPATPPAADIELLGTTGCATCHVPSLQVENAPTPPMYTDLLTHDMGPTIADHHASEGNPPDRFRTTPLWGLRDRPGPYLHDGSAPTLDQAILRHGGDASSSVAAFRALPDASRQRLIALLHTL